MRKAPVLYSILLCACLLALAGCAAVPGTNAAAGAAATPPDRTDIADVLWRGTRGGWVYRVGAEHAAPALDHPVHVDAAWLRNYLASLEMRDERRDREIELTLFNDRQLDHLVPALVRGLAGAQPHQEVVFAVVGPLPGARIFRQTVVTTGRAFVDNGRLNIIFGRVLHTVFDPAEVDGAYVPGTRNSVRIERGREVHSTLWAGDAKRRDWVTIAVQRGSGPLPAPPQSAPIMNDAAARGRADAVAPPPGAGVRDAAGAAARRSGTGMRDKLETLKRLYEDELITREEYARERAEVLENF